MISKLFRLYRSRPIYRQILLYAVIGAFCVAVDFCTFSIFNHFFRLDPLVSNIIGCLAGMICSFFLNCFVNFKTSTHFLRRFVIFITVGSIGLGVSELIMHLGTNVLAANEYLIKLFSVVLVAALQFVLNKFITFREG